MLLRSEETDQPIVAEVSSLGSLEDSIATAVNCFFVKMYFYSQTFGKDAKFLFFIVFCSLPAVAFSSAFQIFCDQSKSSFFT